MTHSPIKKLSIIFVIMGLASCATGSWPNNHQEFKNHFKKPSEVYTVNRSISQVSETWEKQAKKCLNGRITYSVSGGFSYHPDTNLDYRTDIRRSNGKSGIDLKAKMSRQILLGSNTPKDGFFYTLVADAYDAGKSKTRIEIYRGTQKSGQIKLSKILKNWANGKNLGCPDMAALEII